jgi:hypothetical protein
MACASLIPLFFVRCCLMGCKCQLAFPAEMPARVIADQLVSMGWREDGKSGEYMCRHHGATVDA